MKRWMGRIKTDSFLLKLIVVVSIISGAFELGDWLNNKGILPFGFRYQVSGPYFGTSGSLKRIDSPGLATILRKNPASRHIVFFSEIYAKKDGRIFLHVTRPESVLVIMEGKTIGLGLKKYFIPLLLKKGFNPIQIRYSLPDTDPADLHIAFSENSTLLPFPFFRLVWPGKPFSLSKISFCLMVLLDKGRTLVFLLVLLFVFLRILRFGSLQHDLAARRTISFFQLLFQFILDAFFLFNILVFCFYLMRVRIPVVVLFWISIFLSLFFLIPICKNKRVLFILNWKKAGVFFGIVLIILLYVFVTSGSILPLGPIGFGDLNPHLRMIKNFQYEGRFLEEDGWRIYPQSLHASIASSAKLLGLEPEEWITPFLMLMLALLLLSIYLLGNDLFPEIPLYWWFFSLAISNALFIFQSMFISYSFPAIIAVSFFFFALYFYLGNYFPSASLSLAAGICLYPYFTPAFILGIVVFHFWLASPYYFRKWFRLAASLLPAFISMGIYVFIYLGFGFPQQNEGFVTASLLNPFLGLRFWNTSLILAAVVFCFSLKTAKPALAFFSAIACGFLVTYIPYALFNATSTYYEMKNMFILISAGIIFVAAALFFILGKERRNNYWLPIIFFVILIVVILPHYYTSIKNQPRIGVDATAVNRWLLKNSQREDGISIHVKDKNTLSFFFLTLGKHRRLIPNAADNFAFPSDVHWLVIDTPATSFITQLKSFQPAAEFSDFSIFHLDSVNSSGLKR